VRPSASSAPPTCSLQFAKPAEGSSNPGSSGDRWPGPLPVRAPVRSGC
jgi:hypothetical protein